MLRALLTTLIVLFPSLVLTDELPRVAVASNMSHPMMDIAAAYRRETGIKVKLTFGSSGNFTQQIIQGAPFRLFLSADNKYVRRLIQNEIHVRANIKYARGRISLFVPTSSPLHPNSKLDDVIKQMFHGNYDRLVIANPEHAPYGLAAREALHSAGLWVIEKRRLLLAENAAQTAQISLSGNVDAGIIPSSFGELKQFDNRGSFFLLPETWHQPLQQHLLLLEGASAADTKFFNYLQRPSTKIIIEKYGYDIH